MSDQGEPIFKRLKSDDPEVRREAREEQTNEHLAKIRSALNFFVALALLALAGGFVWAIAAASADSGY